MKKSILVPSAFAAAALAMCPMSGHAAAAAFPMPAQADIVKAQGVYAVSQLRVLAVVYGADPSGSASKEAMENGWAPVNRSYASPQHGWPARGPSLGEAIGPLLAQAKAAREACPSYEGACQEQSAAWAKSSSRRIKAAKNPGAELAKVVGELD